VKVWLLGSGSSGNAVLIESGDSRLLVDAGFAPRTLAQRLALIGVAPASIEACVITHEHTDHIKGAAAASKKWGWALYASTGTVAAWPDLQAANTRAVNAGDSISLSRFDVSTFSTPHDAADPIGMVVTARATGARLGLAYDIGHASDAVRTNCRDLDLLILEANHDEHMLRAGPYPPFLQSRIASRTGHLSNKDAAAVAQESVGANLTHIVLAHLSEKCNDHGIARMTVTNALTKARYKGQLHTALQHAPVGPFMPRASRMEPPSQYSLF
jgi:phosphoribosyl 1,2-cyclic phosphodiesterase